MFIKLLDSAQSLQKKVNKAIAEQANELVSKASAGIKRDIKNLVTMSVLSQPEIQSLENGYLKGAFGIQGQSPTQIIADSVAASVFVDVKRYSNSLSGGGMSVNVQPTSLLNLLSLSQGHTVTNKGTDLHWLNWLLTMGDSSIIVDYMYDPSTGKGRSRLGYMKPGGFFRVPPEFSGTENDNFITRALLDKKHVESVFNTIKKVLD